MTKHKLRGLLNLERQGRHAERALLTFRAQEAEADRAYWFGVTDMRERLLAAQRDEIADLKRQLAHG